MPSIRNNLEAIVDFISESRDRIDTNLKLSDVLEDDIIKHIDRALAEELSKQPYSQARPRLAPINVGRKIIRKLSTLYSDPANRDFQDITDQELWDFYSESMNLDVAMADANHFFNTYKYTALEPYVDSEGMPKIRVIPADRFLVWSNGYGDDPSTPEVFIKFLGSGQDGAARFELWDSEEVITVDIGGGNSGKAKGNELKVVTADVNPYGVLPFVYITRSKYRIMPAPDEALAAMTILIPVLLTDLNLISKFQSYSMLYTVDVDVNNLTFGPTNIYNFKSDQQVGAKPQVGVLSPNANIEALSQSAVNQLSMFLETRNLKSSSVGQQNSDFSSSGIAMMIRNIDTTEDRNIQAIYFSQAEKALVNLISKRMHPVWREEGKVADLRSFSQNPRLSIKFADASNIMTDETRIANALMKRDNGLTTQRMALSEVHPDLNAEDIDKLAEDIKNEQSTLLEIRDSYDQSNEQGMVQDELNQDIE